MFKELEDKNRYDNLYGKNVQIKSYVHYPGTEQISIYLTQGYGASEKIDHVVISEHELSVWYKKFKNQSMEENKEPNSGIKKMQNLLLETMVEVKKSTLSPDKAKAISIVGQTYLNSLKVELEFSKKK